VIFYFYNKFKRVKEHLRKKNKTKEPKVRSCNDDLITDRSDTNINENQNR